MYSIFFMSLFTNCVGSENTGKLLYTFDNGTTIEISMFKEDYNITRFIGGIDYFYQQNIIILIVICSWISLIIAITFTANILYGDNYYIDKHAVNYCNSSDDSECISSDDEENKENKDNYESQYFDKLDEMSEKTLTTEDMDYITKQTLVEETPKGLVKMTYNKDTETFEYYTDKFSEITYEILDTIARLFAITFDCKHLCVNYRKEVENGENRMLSEIEHDKILKDIEEQNKNDNTENKQRSVFATFKTYNKKNSNNSSKKYFVITEKANRFKFKGKLHVSEENEQNGKEQKDNDKLDKNKIKQITYSDYKILQEQMDNISKNIN